MRARLGGLELWKENLGREERLYRDRVLEAEVEFKFGVAFAFALALVGPWDSSEEVVVVGDRGIFAHAFTELNHRFDSSAQVG